MRPTPAPPSPRPPRRLTAAAVGLYAGAAGCGIGALLLIGLAVVLAIDVGRAGEPFGFFCILALLVIAGGLAYVGVQCRHHAQDAARPPAPRRPTDEFVRKLRGEE